MYLRAYRFAPLHYTYDKMAHLAPSPNQTSRHSAAFTDSVVVTCKHLTHSETTLIQTKLDEYLPWLLH